MIPDMSAGPERRMRGHATLRAAITLLRTVIAPHSHCFVLSIRFAVHNTPGECVRAIQLGFFAKKTLLRIAVKKNSSFRRGCTVTTHYRGRACDINFIDLIRR